MCIRDRYIGERITRVIKFFDIDPKRFSGFSALVTAAQSALSASIAIWLSKDAWLLYKHWIGPLLGIGLGIWVLMKSRRKVGSGQTPT